ncbi:MAG: Hsp70 family protein [Chloroflexi bacterium]|nr:Hsp70 family protein [Chloroflexota bacterium]
MEEALLEPLIEAIEGTKSDKVTIHSCEIIGGSARISLVQTKILECIQKYEPNIKDLSTTLNGDECIACGSALMCAMLSPNFRVREFQVQDILTCPITISYPTEKRIHIRK